MLNTPKSLMLFAAGFGKRMGALTADRPKPLIEVGGQTLLDHALTLADGQDLTIVLNTHYKAEQITAHLAGRSDITIVNEHPEILETGGGLKNALPHLTRGPVFTLNTDAVWSGPNPLTTLRGGWAEGMDAFVLLVPADRATGHKGTGDFDRDSAGRLTRGMQYIYTGAQIVNPARLADIPETVFSFNRLWDILIEEGRLYGVVHPGGWCDVGQPDSIPLAEALLRNV